MRRSSFLLLGCLLIAAAASCADANAEATTTSSEATSTADLAEAMDVVRVLRGEPGSTPGRCTGCHHQITAATVRRWGTTMRDIEATCFTEDTRPPAERIDCLRETANGQATFAPQRLGLYAAGANSERFKRLFDDAGATDDYLLFTLLAGMPRSGEPLTAEEFEKARAWVLRGMPQLDAAFAAPNPP